MRAMFSSGTVYSKIYGLEKRGLLKGKWMNGKEFIR